MTEYFTEQRDIGDTGRSESEKYKQLLKLMSELCSKRRELLRKKMPVPLFSFFRMTLSPWYAAEKIERE